MISQTIELAGEIFSAHLEFYQTLNVEKSHSQCPYVYLTAWHSIRLLLFINMNLKFVTFITITLIFKRKCPQIEVVYFNITTSQSAHEDFYESKIAETHSNCKCLASYSKK